MKFCADTVSVDIQKVTDIVREAGQIMADHHVEVRQKGNDSNYVMTADIKVERFLTEKLTNLLPGSRILGEESDQKSLDGNLLWVIDPIDGTSNFIRGIGLSAISVGLVLDGEPCLGVIYEPVRDEMFQAEKGKGAYLNGRRIHVSDRDFRHSHLCSAMSLYDKRFAPPCLRIIDRVYQESDDLRRLGTAALELAYLACGRVELYFEIRLFPWDVAAGAVIIREAGGLVEFLYQDRFPLDRPFPLVAANTRENFARLKTIVQEELPEMPNFGVTL